MIFYAIDTDARQRIYFYLALLGTAITSSLLFLENFMTYRLLAPSSLIIYGALIKFFDSILWKLPLINLITHIPNLNGVWEGFFQRAEEYGQEPIIKINVTLKISQTWSKISITTETEKTVSDVKTISMWIENPNDIRLSYIYLCRNKAGFYKNEYAEGFTELRLEKDEDGLLLKGPYYSNRPRKGYSQFRLIKK
jgi:hypothetical protein